MLAATGLIVFRWLGQAILNQLNRRHVLDHAGSVPGVFRGQINDATYAKSVNYTLAKNQLSQVEDAWSAVVLLAVLWSGVLPWAFALFQDHFGSSAWSGAAFLLCGGIALSIPGLPLDWHHQFRLEERFGFNTSTQKLWWMDRVKGLMFATLLGYPLLVLILKLAGWTGSMWWLWAWGVVLLFQLVLMVVAPMVILPFFNKFTPLADGSLRERLLKLGDRTGFTARTIQVMDGSRRSRHSNAYFTGFGRFRKIVLFDTLIAQLSEVELESVLAHEIGHYKKRHIPKMLAWSALSSLAAFYLLAVLAGQGWFYEGFGFESGEISAALLLFTLLAGTVTFWLTPLGNHWSRKHEYEADAYAADTMGETSSLSGALRKLTEKNLGNLTPHPAFSAFHYSHPTLLEREQAMADRTAGQASHSGGI